MAGGFGAGAGNSLDGNFQVFEFPTDFIVDTGALDQIYTGSGIHLNRDIIFSFSFLDNQQTTVSSDIEFINNPLINLITYDILDTGGNVVFANYKSGTTSTTLQITETENENIFGNYTKDFGVRATLSNYVTNDVFQAEFYVYGNVPKIQYYNVNDGRSTVSKNIEIIYQNPSTGYGLTTKTEIYYPDVQDEYASADDGIIEYFVSGQSGDKNLYIDNDPPNYYIYWETGVTPNVWRIIDDFNVETGFSTEDTTYPWEVITWEGDTGFFGGSISKYYANTESIGSLNTTATTSMTYLTGRGGIQLVTIDVDNLVNQGLIDYTGISGGIKIVRYADWDNETGVSSVAYSAINHNGIIDTDSISPGVEATGGQNASTNLDAISPLIFEASGLTINSGQVTGQIEIDLKLMNDLTYTRMISYDIYASTSNNIVLYDARNSRAQDNPFYLKTVPVQTIDGISNIILDPESLLYNTPYYFAIVPNSAIGTGEALFFGPNQFVFNGEENPESIFSVNRLRITKDSSFVDMMLISGAINVSGEAVVLDTINRGEFTTIDYLTSIIDGSGTAFSSNIKIVDSYQAQAGSGIYFTEYATGANNYGTYSIETGDSTFSLLLSGVEPQVTYKLFRTAL